LAARNKSGTQALDEHQRRRGGRERDVAEQERVAVGRRLCDLVGADRTAAAADVLDHEALPHGLGQALCDQPRQHVGGGSGRKWHHDANRARRVLRLRQHRGRHHRAADRCRAFENISPRRAHWSPP
jgi:hypothetical protein